MSNTVKLILAIVLLVVLATYLIYSAQSFLVKRKKLSDHEKFVRFNRRFNFYYDFWLSRKLFRKIFAQVSNLAVYNYMEARIQTVRFFERSLEIAAAVFVVSFIGFGDIVTGILLFMVAVILINNSISKRIDNVNYEGLRAISTTCSNLSDSYKRLRNIPDALNQCKPPKILERAVESIYLILTANDGRERLDTFFIENQNRQLRTLAVTCYLRNDTGEDTAEGSPFRSALRLIKDEVDGEIVTQLNQRLMFRTLEYLPFIALFCYPIFKAVMQYIVPATTGVYASTSGYACKLILVLVVLGCYYVLSTMNNASVARTNDRLDFITNLLYHDKVRKFARTLIPKSFRKRQKIQEMIDGCLSSKNMEYVALEKFVFGVIGMIASVILSIAIIFGARRSIYDSLSDSSMTTQLTYTAAQEKAVLEFQHNIMDSGVIPDEEAIKNFFMSEYPKITSLDLDAHTKRLQSVVTRYAKTRFRWFYCFVYIGAWFGGHLLSSGLLLLRSKLVESEAELDVLQLQTVIAILMDTSLDTLSVLYWLAKSSDIHKDVLTYCYHEYTRDPEMALDILRDKAAIPEFVDMCNKLKTTIEQVTLNEAFSDLILDRAVTLEIRKTVQLSALKRKRTLASPVAVFPVIVWMIIGFLYPIVVVALQTATTTLSGLNNLGG